MSGITGDFDELEEAIYQLRNASTAVPRGLDRAAIEIQAMARSNYASERGPDGKKWAPNSDGSSSKLVALASQVTFKGQGNALVGEAPDALKYHTTKRPVFPAQGTMPAPWLDIIEESIAEELENSI
jgi:hypothetical protein